MADVGTGAVGLLRMDVSESNLDAAANTSVVNYAFYLIENGPNHQSSNSSSVPASVDWSGVTTVWAGSFGFNWSGAGYQTTPIASGSFTVTHNPDGSGFVWVQGNMGDTGTSGAGGPTSVAQGITLTTLRVLPGTPTNVAATRNSDSQVAVSWQQSSASNGQPTSEGLRARVNDADWAMVATFAPSSSVAVSAAANQKIVYSVQASNAAGLSAWSADSAPVFTTPAAPTDVAAWKDANQDIIIAWTRNVAFFEHVNVVEHGTVAGGVTTWDGSPLATVPAGDLSFKHVAPNPSQVHVYRTYAKNTDTGALQSATVLSNTVQLLAAPNKPTLPAMAPYADKASAFVYTWTHNPVDTTPQSAYEVSVSTNGGSTWSTTGKVLSTVSSRTDPANSWAANTQLTFRVHTWGQATTGGSDGTGASPWSDLATVTFKTRPVVTITAPTATYTRSSLDVQLGFSQAEGASFVSATIDLYQGATLLEHLVSTTRVSTMMSTRVESGTSYTVKVTVLDSNGLTSDLVASTFSVNYTKPVTAGVTVTYLEESGVGQIDITIPTPGAGEVAAVAVTITRTIDGKTETVVDQYPAAPSLTILDMTPTVHGTNLYTVTTVSVDGATVDAAGEIVTSEGSFAFLSSGPGFTDVVRFASNLKVAAAPSRSTALVATAGRARPIALFGQSGALEVSGSATLLEGVGSTGQEVEQFILNAGLVCYRDPTGRRIFGAVSGNVDTPSTLNPELQFKVVEAS